MKAQLQFELNDDRLSIAWEGVDLRGLTRGGMLLYLQRERGKSMSDLTDPLQVEIDELLAETLRPVYRGAPLLVEPSMETE